MKLTHTLIVVLSLAARFGQAATIEVNTAADEFAEGLTTCSLREAVQAANTNSDFFGCERIRGGDNDVIELRAGGSYVLTRVGINEDNNETSDLDVRGESDTESLTIVRPGPLDDVTISISGSSNARGRLLHLHRGELVVRNATVRNGLVPGGQAGGGIRTEPGTRLLLDGVVLEDNTADGNAGGLLARGDAELIDCIVQNNRTLNAAVGGGGVFVSPGVNFRATGTRFLNNTVNLSSGAGDGAAGGGLLHQGTSLTLAHVQFAGNIVRSAGGPAGGGFTALAGTVDIAHVTVNNNQLRAANSIVPNGTGFRVADVTGTLANVLVLNNSTQNDDSGTFSGGAVTLGGIDAASRVLMVDSVVEGNRSENASPSGVTLADFATLDRVSIVDNESVGSGSDGGGIRAFNNTRVLNSTIANNRGANLGGGISVINARTQIRFTTISGNQANEGGGLFCGATAICELSGTILAGNSAESGPDCAGSFVGVGNLVQSGTGCGESPGTLLENPQLGALEERTGPVAGTPLAGPNGTRRMRVREPLATSPGIDRIAAGVVSECAANRVDQLGRPRLADADGDGIVRCDLGGVERQDVLLADGFE